MEHGKVLGSFLLLKFYCWFQLIFPSWEGRKVKNMFFYSFNFCQHSLTSHFKWVCHTMLCIYISYYIYICVLHIIYISYYIYTQYTYTIYIHNLRILYTDHTLASNWVSAPNENNWLKHQTITEFKTVNI